MSLILAAVLCVASALVLLEEPSSAGPPYPAPVMRGYIPLEANATQGTMETASPDAGPILDFAVGITNAGGGAVMFYDHFEDGFEADLVNAAQDTTEIWGDLDTANGDAAAYCGALCAGDQLPAGAVFVLRNNIPTPRVVGNVLWDGGDRVSSTRGFTITAVGFTTALGSLLSASASAYDTTKWGVDFWIPVGENMIPPSGATDAFATTGVQVMADQPDTLVEVDRDGDGDIDQTGTIGPGQVVFVDGGVNRGARVRSTKPVQVHMGAGDPAAPANQYELRWFTLFPTPLLSADYLNPVGSSNNNQRTITYLFNPGTAAITVTPTCTGCTGTIPVAAGDGASFASPTGQAVRFQSSGGAPFVAVGALGSESGAAPGSGSDTSPYYDWGFGLVPTGLLTSKALLGLAPGNSANPPASEGADNFDDDPVWISALGDTVLYVDYDGNPATGAEGPLSGGPGGACTDARYDAELPVTALESRRIHDPDDGDMTGASIFTCDGTKISGAWGQDPELAPPGSPGFDAGYTLIPSTAMLVDKTNGLAEDTNGDDRIGPGDVVYYEISVADAGAFSFTNLSVSDPIPAGTTYVAGSTTYDDGTGTGPAPFADDQPPAATPYPFDEGGASLPTVDPGRTVRLRYEVEVAVPFPAGTSITNTVSVVSEQAEGGDTVVTELVAADLSLAKARTNDPTYLGENAVFQLTLTNSGPDEADDVVVTDLLPPGLAFVSAIPSQGTYDANSGLWQVGDVPNGTAPTLQITARVNQLNVVNVAEITSALAADPDSTPGNGSGDEDDDATAPVVVLPQADLELFKAIVGEPTITGTTFALILVNEGPGTSAGVTVTEHPPPLATFVSAAPRNSPAVDGTFDGTNGVWTVPDLAPGEQAVMDVVYRTPVAPGINYAQVATSTVHDPDSQPDTTPLTSVDPPNQDDEAEAVIEEIGDVELTNEVTTPPAFVGDLVTFTVTVANQGPTNTTNVCVVDQLPAGLQYVSSVAAIGSYDNLSGLWCIGDMASGETRTLDITARVLTPGPKTTTAEVTSSTARDNDSPHNNHAAGEDDQDDAGVDVGGASLGDTVWFDRDADFVKDPDELGLAGVNVNVRWAGPDGVLGGGDDVVTMVTTDATGAWSLSGLPHGPYEVTVDDITLPHGITTATRDKDGNTSAHITTFTLNGGENLTDVDFGYVGSGLVGDTIFLDTNGNGTPDATEGIPGITVQLVWHGPDGVADAGPGGDDVEYTTVTDGDGKYQFPNLPAGSYHVTSLPGGLPAGVRNNIDPDGGDDATAAFTLGTGETNLNLDFGYIGTNAIGDRVFSDLDGDGVQDPGEPGLGGVPVTLEQDVDGDGTYETTVKTVDTAGNGNYLFDELPAGRYRATIDPPSGLDLSTPGTVTRTVDTGEEFLDADFGLKAPPTVNPGSIGDLVWEDKNGNGVPDPGEPGIGGAKITLWAPGGPGQPDKKVATQTSRPDGSYGFANLPPGSYRVTITPPSGFSATTPISVPVPLGSGASVDTADFGFTSGAVPTGTIGDLVWEDTNADGLLESGEGGGPPEAGLAGVELTLRQDTDGDGVYETVVGTTTTNASGNYSFTGLPPGSYRVIAEGPTGYEATRPVIATVNLGAGQTVDTADFAFINGSTTLGSIGDRIWLDTDRDGVQDPGEPGINEVMVTLRSDTDGDGVYETEVGTATTSGDGNYMFPDLDPALYRVEVTPPSGLAPTVAPIVVPLGAGQNVLTADIGLASPPSIPFDLEVGKTAESPAVNGSEMTWLFTVTNNGIGATPDVLTVNDNLPAGLAYRSASGAGWTCAAKGQKVTCTGGGPLDVDESTTFRIVTLVNAASGQDIRNGADVSAAGLELDDQNNTDVLGVFVAAPPADPDPPLNDPPLTDRPPADATPPQAVVPPLPRTDTLPVTGSDIPSLLWFATGLMATGTGFMAFARRRNSRQ